MKLTATILACGLAAGLASAQNFSVIQNTREKMQGVRDNAAAASNAALGVQDSAPSAAEALHKTVAPAKASSAPAVKPVSAKTGKADAAKVKAAPKSAAPKSDPMSAKAAAPASAPAASTAPVASVVPEAAANDDKPGENKWSAGGKRDPFISPVVQRANGGSGCSTGKKCLEIGDINLRGVVHSEAGFIAVVSNGLNKAYFLRENDPVFNGYVVKITGDSIVFQETLQDRLGKSFTREVTKKITTPAV